MTRSRPVEPPPGAARVAAARTAGARALAALTGALALLAVAPAAFAQTEVQTTWHADQARVPDARSAGRGGAGVVVAVLDSWVDRAHPDFSGRVLPGADCLGGACVPGPASSDQCDHGTHVGGTVASSSFGVAPRATILPVRVLAYDPASGECVGRPDDVAAGIRWALANGARVLNLSLGPDVPGLSASSSIPAAVDEAAEAGAVVVFSAGNASLPVTDAYGGRALIVAATGPDGGLASYSQRGAGVDLAAPGGDPATTDVCTREDCVISLFPGKRYSVAAGTSMAAPHVSGIAALLIGQEPSRTREQVFERLLGTARPLADAGRGLVDARAALGVPATPPTRAQSAPAPVVVSPPARTPGPVRSAVPPPAPVAPSPSPVAPPPPPAAPSPEPAVAAPPSSTPVEPTAAAPSDAEVPVGVALAAAALVLLAGAGTAFARRDGR